MLSSPFERRGGGAQSFNPVAVFDSDLVTWYGNSVDELWRAQSSGGPVTLYQDGAGTTPVTAVEQFVGLVLDKSQLPLGTTGPTTGWIKHSGDGTVTFDGDLVTITGATVSTRVTPPPSWRPFRPGITRLRIVVTSLSGSWLLYTAGAPISVSGVGAFSNTSTSTNSTLDSVQGTGSISFRVVEVTEAPGYHLSQSTATARPKLIQRTDLSGSPFALRSDGTDDRLLSGTIDLAGVPGVQVIGTAVRTAGAARAVLAGFGDPISNTNGFSLEYATDGATADAGFRVRSGGSAGIAASASPLLTPMVLSGWWNASDKLGRSRINGGATQTAAGASGNTGLGSGALSVGARPAGTNGFAGDIFALPMIVKRLMTPAELSAAEKAFGKSIGVLQ